MTIEVGRPLSKTEQSLPNRVELVAVPLDRVKGRHWRAVLLDDDGVEHLVGEYLSWQQTQYRRKADAGEKTNYPAPAMRTSWLVGPKGVGDPDSKRGQQIVTELVPLLNKKAVELSEEERKRVSDLVADRPHPDRRLSGPDGWKAAVRKIKHPSIRRLR